MAMGAVAAIMSASAQEGSSSSSSSSSASPACIVPSEYASQLSTQKKKVLSREDGIN